MFDPSKEYETWNWRFILTRGDQLRLIDIIREAFDDLGLDVIYSEIRGVQVIEDRKRRGI